MSTSTPARPRLSPQRLLTAAVLATWAGLFWFLLLTGRTSLYLSSRTSWVVPMGAAFLTVAAAGRILTARTTSTSTLSARDSWGLGLLVLPVAAILVLPPTTLGAYAASRRSSFLGAGFTSSPKDLSSGELTLVDLGGASRSREGMRALADRAGENISLVGFVVTDKATPVDEFLLTRFIVTCCAADALSVQIRVIGAPPGKFHNDDWVRVEGPMYPLGEQIVVQAEEISGIERPKHPYLTP